MPANHNTPHTQDTKDRISLTKRGKPCIRKNRIINDADGTQLYRCGTCKKHKQRECFYPSKRGSLGIKSQCKPCHSITAISSRNPLLTQRSRRASEATRRARKAKVPGVVRTNDWARLLEILGHACLKCGTSDRITQDHIVPLAHGGDHHPTNLQPLCRRCNECKQASTADYRTPSQRAEIESVWAYTFKVVEIKK